MIKFEVIKGDILDMRVDVVVNATNQNLTISGGLSDKIIKGAGPNLVKECSEINGCSIGKAKITMSYDLESKGIGWVIHAVGPRYVGGMYFEEDLLADVYKAVLDLTLTYESIYKDQCLEVLNHYVGNLDTPTKQAYVQDTKNELREYSDTYPIKSIAFPSMSTGAYGYPIDEAAKIAVKTIKAFCKNHDHLEYVLLVCEDQVTYNAYKKAI
jgi:O-acetyl-ADP-ribose deacetylase (regulator of RNase III)